MIFEDFM